MLTDETTIQNEMSEMIAFRRIVDLTARARARARARILIGKQVSSYELCGNVHFKFLLSLTSFLT